MVTMMTTPPPLSASSPGVLDSSTSSNGSVSSGKLLKLFKYFWF